jgi:alpha-beta hydrolase superfamily lysophospholipase
MKKSTIALLAVLVCAGSAVAQQAVVVKNDMQIDGLDPGIKIFIREKMAQGNTRFANDNIVLFLHGATGPSTCDFDLQYKDYSWADWFVKRGYVVYMGDYRNYGGSTREAAMDEPATKTNPSRARILRCATSKQWSIISNALATCRR